MKNKISIDLGSAFTKIYKSNADIVLYEPTAIAIENNNYKKALDFIVNYNVIMMSKEARK